MAKRFSIAIGLVLLTALQNVRAAEPARATTAPVTQLQYVMNAGGKGTPDALALTIRLQMNF